MVVTIGHKKCAAFGCKISFAGSKDQQVIYCWLKRPTSYLLLTKKKAKKRLKYPKLSHIQRDN